MLSISEKYKEFVREALRIIITSHKRPDGDSIGSCVGMHYWTKLHFPEKEVHIYYPGEKDSEFKLNPLFENIEWVHDASEKLCKGDMLVLVDGSELQRFFHEPEKLKLDEITTFCIDHHEKSDQGYDFYHCEPDAVSTSELIAKYFYTDDELKNVESSEYLLSGIIRDTRNFTYVDKTNSQVFLQTKRLVDNSDLRIKKISKKLYSMKPEHFELFRKMVNHTKNEDISEKIPPFTYSFLNKEEASLYDAATISNGFEHYVEKTILQISGYPWGFALVPEEESYRVSFRSSWGGPNVQKIASEFFGGGGHAMAAGVRIPIEEFTDTEEAAQFILQKIIENEDKLTIINGSD